MAVAQCYGSGMAMDIHLTYASVEYVTDESVRTDNPVLRECLGAYATPDAAMRAVVAYAATVREPVGAVVSVDVDPDGGEHETGYAEWTPADGWQVG